jgi:phage portal protein BeeE
LDNGLQYQSVATSQKEMDFVETRRFTRDEVLAIYKVPKAIMGITDDVNRATAQVAQSIFAEVALQPLCKMIEQQLNAKVFKGI